MRPTGMWKDTGQSGGRPRRATGFSLAEMVVALVLGAMVLVTVLGIYGQASRAISATLQKVEGPALAAEVLQLIAQDLTRTLGGEDVTIQIKNGFDNQFPRAELVLRRTFHDSENQEKPLEEIIWRAAYDPQSEIPGLVLYRSYNGVAPEDKLLDSQRADWEKNYPFVPICPGVTFFRVEACKGEDLLDQWATPALPPGVKVTLSFAEPYDTVQGTKDVIDEEKVSRTMVLDATRAIKFSLTGGAGAEPNTSPDPNQPKAEEKTSKDRSSKEKSVPSKATKTKSAPRQLPRQPSLKDRSSYGQTPKMPPPTSTRSR